MLGFMPFDDSFHERVWRAFNSEVPVRVDAHGLVARADCCAAWVDAVDLYSSVLRLRMCIIVTPERAARAGTPHLRLTSDPPLDGREGAVLETAVDIDGDRFSEADGTLHHAGAGSSSSGMSHISWWLPSIPARELAVSVRATSLGLAGTVTFDASSWPSTTAGILSL